MTPYERAILRDARRSLANPYRTPLSTLAHAIARREARDAEGAPPLAPDALAPIAEASAVGLGAITAAAASTLRERGVWRAFARAGTPVRGVEDVQRLALWEIDEVAEPLRTKYAFLAITLGACAPALGAAGLALDAPLAVGLAARAVLELATTYGFDPRDPDEQAFAMQVLVASVVPGVDPRRADAQALAGAWARVARAWRVGSRRAWALPLALRALRRLLRRDAGTRVVRRLAGLAAASANAWLVVGVVETAQAAYRRRFLARDRALTPSRDEHGEARG
jgi:hypothetical protein